MTDFVKRILLPLALVCFLGLSQPASTAERRGIDVIWAYAGEWQVKTEGLATPYSQVKHEEKRLRNNCWKDGNYLACNQYVDGESKVLVVFSYNQSENSYVSYQIPPDGSEAGSGKVMIEGNVWTFPWQITKDGKTIFFHVVNVWSAPNQIEYRKEFSEDNSHWTVMERGIETKLHD